MMNGASGQNGVWVWCSNGGDEAWWGDFAEETMNGMSVDQDEL